MRKKDHAPGDEPAPPGDWTPRVGEWKATRHLVVRGGLAFGVALGSACFLASHFRNPNPITVVELWFVRGFLWAPIGMVFGFVTGELVSRRLVAGTGLAGSKLVLAAASFLILVHVGACALGAAALGREWFLRMASFQAGACLVALGVAIRRILIDS